MITINLYDYKRIIRDVGIQKSLAWVAMGTTLSLLVCIMIWIFQNMLIGLKESDLAEVQAEVALATPDYNAVQKLTETQKQYGEIITGIDKLRSGQANTTEFLEDLARSVPDGIWLESMNQMDMGAIRGKKVPFLFINYEVKMKRRNKGEKGPADQFIALNGKAKTDQSIVHFLEQIRALPYIDAVVLHSSDRSWVEGVPVQKFSIYCHFLKLEPAA